jgi:hypothetical protein
MERARPLQDQNKGLLAAQPLLLVQPGKRATRSMSSLTVERLRL